MEGELTEAQNEAKAADLAESNAEHALEEANQAVSDASDKLDAFRVADDNAATSLLEAQSVYDAANRAADEAPDAANDARKLWEQAEADKVTTDAELLEAIRIHEGAADVATNANDTYVPVSAKETAHAESENVVAAQLRQEEAQNAFNAASEHHIKAAEDATQAREAADGAQTIYDDALNTADAANRKETLALKVEGESSGILKGANENAALKAGHETQIREAVTALQAQQAPIQRRRLLTMESLLREIELS